MIDNIIKLSNISVGVDFKAVRIPQEHGGREAPGDTPISTQKKLNARTQSRPRSTNSSGGPSRTPRSSKNGIWIVPFKLTCHFVGRSSKMWCRGHYFLANVTLIRVGKPKYEINCITSNCKIEVSVLTVCQLY